MDDDADSLGRASSLAGCHRVPRMKKLLLAIPLAAGVLALTPSDEPFDLLITGGRVVDGTGAPWFVADVGDSRREDRGGRSARGTPREEDASTPEASYVSPGFIDLLGQSEYNVLVDKRAASKITQGITTEVTGEGELDRAAQRRDARRGKGRLPALRRSRPTSGPWAATSRRFERRGSAINLGTFVGAGSRARLRHRQGGPPRDSGGAREDAGGRRPGDARGRARRLVVAPVRPRHVQLDRRAHRDGEGRRALRRRLLHAPALRGRTRSTPRSTRSSASRRKRASAARSGT